MQVHIDNLSSTVRAIDGDALLSPQVMEKIVPAVLSALREQEEHRARVKAEQQVGLGVRHELEHLGG